MARFSPVFLVVAFVIALTYSSAPAFAQSLPQSLPADATGITDPVEHQAYLEALNTENTFTIDKFVTGYPQSSGLEKVLQHSIARYVDSSDSVLNYWASGEEKVLEFACDKTIQILKQQGPNGRRSADSVANYCRAVYRSMGHGRNATLGQAVAGKTLSPFSIALDGNNAAKPQ